MQPFNIIPWERGHFDRQQSLILEIEKLYAKYQREYIKLGYSTKFNSTTKRFAFQNYPQLKKKINELMLAMQKEVVATIEQGQAEQWIYANEKQDAFLKHVLGNKLALVPKSYFARNLQALNAFKIRKDGGLGLSDRVWNQTKQFRQEMELALDVGLDGRSAAKLANDVKILLKEPDKLFRRVRDKHGNLKLSSTAKAYHPGQGVYRSSYKNAERLARTEINMAYRTADHLRFMAMDFIVGFEVKLSNRGDSCPMCVALAGKYPKKFLFRSWHSNCRCYVIAILSTEDEFFDSLKDNYKEVVSENTIKKPHKGFYDWLEENKERIKKAKSTPYFVGDNPKYFKGIRDNTT